MNRYALIFVAALASTAAADPYHDTCVQVFHQQRTCTDTYIPALVDLRAKLDLPAGIKAKVATHRDDVIAEAKKEWAHDSTDAWIEQTCKQVPNDPQMLATAKSCLAKSGCDAFVSCIMPLTEKIITKQIHK